MNKGFTLIEAIIVIVILGIIGGFTVSFLVSSTRTYQIMKIQGELYQEGLYIIERISHDIIDSRGTDSGCPNGFMRSHTSRDTTLCTQYILDTSASILNRNDQPIGGNVISFSRDYSTLPYSVSLILEKECGMAPNKDGTTPRCRVDLSTSVMPRNLSSMHNGNYEEVIY